MNFQVGDFVEVFYQVNKQTCRGEVVSVNAYQITILTCFGDSKLLKSQVGYEMRINLDPSGKNIIIKKCETSLTESELISLMHLALQLNDKEWFEELGERKKQFISPR